MEQSPSWEANQFSVSQEISAFYGTRRFITAFTSAHHMSLCQARSIQSIYPHPHFLKFNLNIILPLTPVSSKSLPQVSPSKILLTSLLPPIHATRPAHLILDFITWKIMGEQYRSLRSSLYSFLHSPVTSPLLGPNILPNTLFSNTLNLRSSVNVSDQVSHSYKTKAKL